MLLELTPDELLATTRSVRKRLDLARPVEREVLEECLRLGQQAPTASYAQNWDFVVVTDPERWAALGELWRAAAGRYDHAPVVVQASRWGSITPAAWSFMLAARNPLDTMVHWGQW